MKENKEWVLSNNIQPIPGRILKAGKLSCLYENGNLRYIQLGEVEILRMIYAAVRDDNWITIPYTIENERIEIHENQFQISYTALYHSSKVRYKAEVNIHGSAEEGITFHFKGHALKSFMRNRIGLCVLHPIKECQGKPIDIFQPDGQLYRATFPVLISPHQPFKNVQAMHWRPAQGLSAEVSFEGDIFETEDHRNWSDASYKTYSTPLEYSFPVVVQPDDIVDQKVTLKINTHETFSPFPALGYAKTSLARPLSSPEIELLKMVPFDHYRVELHLDQQDWQSILTEAGNEAQQLDTGLELVVFFNQATQHEWNILLETLKPWTDHILSILPLQKGIQATPPELLKTIYPLLKQHFPMVKVGYGTNGFFTEFNRNPPANDNHFDFVAFSLNPQAHASDIRTIAENLEALPWIVRSAQQLAPGKEIYVSAFTFKTRFKTDAMEEGLPYQVDARLTTEFAAAFTLMAIAQLAGVARITLYETVGWLGIMQGDEDPAWPELFPTKAGQVFPVYEMLKRLKEFKPVELAVYEKENVILKNEEKLEIATKTRLEKVVLFQQN